MKELELPKDYNYIACFLTFACQLRCPYCINHHGGNLVKKRRMSGKDWVKAINRIKPVKGLPITLQGGEPTVHKDFYYIVNNIREDHEIDVLTNFEVDVDRWFKEIAPKRLRRDSKYASIRVSYHKGQSDRDALLERVYRAQQKGYHIGIWAVDHPDPEIKEHHKRFEKDCKQLGIDFRYKEFLGPWGGKVYGSFKYPDAVNSRKLRLCICRTSELLIGPKGQVFRCHSDLYANRHPIGNMLDDELARVGMPLPCYYYGKCNSCDVKVTTNRFQESGHTSVDITELSSAGRDNDEYVEEVVNTYGKR